MKSLTITLDEPTSPLWQNLPPAIQKLLTEKALDALLNGRTFPSGPEKLELAIELAEAGVDADTIERLTFLDQSIFEGFMLK